jgi:hypothetical protein
MYKSLFIHPYAPNPASLKKKYRPSPMNFQFKDFMIVPVQGRRRLGGPGAAPIPCSPQGP